MTSAPRIAACVVVRMKSTRLPRKALADIGGKPLLRRLVDRLRLTRSATRIVICTSDHPDDAVLVEFAQRECLDVIVGSQEDVLSRLAAAAERYDADVVIRVTGDNVLTDAPQIDRMVERHLATDAEYTRTNGLPLGVTAELLARTMLPRLAALLPEPSHSEYLMLYAFDPERFRCEVLEAPPELRRPFHSLTVDTPADLERIRRIYATVAPDGSEPDLASVIRVLDQGIGAEQVSAEAEIRLPDGRSATFGALLRDLDERAARARALQRRR